VRHHRYDAYSAKQVLLNKRQIYGDAPKVNCYQSLYLYIKLNPITYLILAAYNLSEITLRAIIYSKF